MPDYDLTIDGKGQTLHWDRPTPPTKADIEGVVAQYRAKRAYVPSAASFIKGANARLAAGETSGAKAAVSRNIIGNVQDYQEQYENGNVLDKINYILHTGDRALAGLVAPVFMRGGRSPVSEGVGGNRDALKSEISNLPPTLRGLAMPQGGFWSSLNPDLGINPEAKGIAPAIARAALGLGEPSSAALIASTGGLGKLAQGGGALAKAAGIGSRVASGGFAAQSAASIPKSLQNYNEDPSGAITGAAIDALFAGLAGHHAARGEPSRPAPSERSAAPAEPPAPSSLEESLATPLKAKIKKPKGAKAQAAPAPVKTVPNISGPTAAKASAPPEGLAGLWGGREIIPLTTDDLRMNEPIGDVGHGRKIRSSFQDLQKAGHVSFDLLSFDEFAKYQAERAGWTREESLKVYKSGGGGGKWLKAKLSVSVQEPPVNPRITITGESQRGETNALSVGKPETQVSEPLGAGENIPASSPGVQRGKSRAKPAGAGEAQAAVEAPPQAEAAAPLEPVKPQETVTSHIESGRALADEQGITPLTALYKEAKRANPKLTKSAFAQQIQEEAMAAPNRDYEFVRPGANVRKNDIFTANWNGKPNRLVGVRYKRAAPAAETPQIIVRKPSVKPGSRKPGQSAPGFTIVPKPLANAAEVVGKMLEGWHGGRFRATESVDPQASADLHRYVASFESAETRGAHAAREVLGGLSKTEKGQFEKLALHNRAVSKEDLGGSLPNVPKMTVAEAAAAIANKNVQKAVATHQATIQPYLLGERQTASPKLKPARTRGDFFVPLVAKTDAAGKPIGASAPMPGGSVPSRYMKKGTAGAREAKGTAKTYETDYQTAITDRLKEVQAKANKARLYEGMLARGTAVKPKKGQKPPTHITIKGVDHPAVPVWYAKAKIKGKGEIIHKLYVPQDVAKDLDDAMGPKGFSESESVYAKTQRIATGAALLANPAELTSHVHRILSALSKIPGAGESVVKRAVANLVPILGPKLTRLHSLYNLDMNKPENMAVLQRIMDNNAGSSRAFSDYMMTKIPGLKQIQAKTHHFLFGLPEGKGLSGFDLRVRVLAEKIRERVEGPYDPNNPKDAARVREFANQFGQYTRHPDKLIRDMKWINPYAATQLPVRLTELRQLFGGSGLKAKDPHAALLLRAETLWRGTAGTILAFTLINRSLSGHYPWENAEGHQTDLEIGKDSDGKPVYFSGTKIAPDTLRALRTSTLTAQIPVKTKGWGKKGQDKGIESGRLLANEGLNAIASPLSSLLLAGAKGKAPYFTRGGDLLQLTPSKVGGWGKAQPPGLSDNIRHALIHANPLVTRITGDTPGYAADLKSPFWKKAKLAEYIFGPSFKKDK